MLNLDGKARVFVGSSFEGKAAALKVAEALEAAGMRALLWSDFFKTKDPPLQELDRRAADADGAVLVGSADDRVQSRGKRYEQMRDNVLLEYGLFAGQLGRHRCVLLMPDQPNFRIPSDFLGVAGFEWYSDSTLNEVVNRVPTRLSEGFAADAFQPPNLKERCRRALLLTAWVRAEVAQIDLSGERSSMPRSLGAKAESVLAFLKEDIEALDLRATVDELSELVEHASDAFPGMPGQGAMTYMLRREIQDFLRHPRGHFLLSRCDPDHDRYRVEDLLGPEGARLLSYAQSRSLCPACIDERQCLGRSDRPYMHSFLPIRGSHYHYFDDKGDCLQGGWYLGAIDMLAFLDGAIRNFLEGEFGTLDRWRREWMPRIMEQLGAIETTVHQRIFGHF